MFISIGTIIGIVLIVLLYLLITSEKKGLLLKSEPAIYFSKLKELLKNFQIDNKSILTNASSHLSSEFKTYKRTQSPLTYTQDLVESSNNPDSVYAWCCLFIIYNLKNFEMFESDESRKIKTQLAESIKKTLESKSYPESFDNYFKI